MIAYFCARFEIEAKRSYTSPLSFSLPGQSKMIAYFRARLEIQAIFRPLSFALALFRIRATLIDVLTRKLAYAGSMENGANGEWTLHSKQQERVGEGERGRGSPDTASFVGSEDHCEDRVCHCCCPFSFFFFLPASNIFICNSKRETFERRIVT